MRSLKWLPYLMVGILLAAVAYLLLAPGPSRQSPSGDSSTRPTGEDAAREFAKSQPDCARVTGIERISETRPLYRIECVDHQGNTFTIQFASTD